MEKTLVVELKNKYGLHVRPSTALAQLCGQFTTTQITIAANNGAPVDAKNIMGLMTLGAPSGTKLIVRAVGDDAEVAIEKINELVAGRFGGIE